MSETIQDENRLTRQTFAEGLGNSPHIAMSEIDPRGEYIFSPNVALAGAWNKTPGVGQHLVSLFEVDSELSGLVRATQVIGQGGHTEQRVGYYVTHIDPNGENRARIIGKVTPDRLSILSNRSSKAEDTTIDYFSIATAREGTFSLFNNTSGVIRVFEAEKIKTSKEADERLEAGTGHIALLHLALKPLRGKEPLSGKNNLELWSAKTEDVKRLLF